MAKDPCHSGVVTTDEVEQVIKAYGEIGKAEERYRKLLREALGVRGNQARIAAGLGVAREKLRQDAMTEQERQAVREADAARKAAIRQRAKAA